MTDPTPNMLLLRRVLTQIDTHPETYYQGWYGRRTPCRTAYCVAGHAVVLSGLEVEWGPVDVVCSYETASSFLGEKHIGVVAQDLLGLTVYEANDLFDGINQREDIERVCEAIARRAGEPLWPNKEVIT